MIYMDAAATANFNNDIDYIIIDTMIDAMKRYWENPSSLYASNVKNKINECRENISKFINANSEEIYFTSGGSESNSWAIQGFVNRCWLKGVQPIVITSTIEHKSILNCIKNSSAEVYFVNVNKHGLVEFDALEEALMRAICYNKENYIENYNILVSIQFANNEIGTCQHIKMISSIVHEYGGVFHTDAVQAFGHIPIDVKDLGIDMMSISGHKISPILKGIGFLYKKDGVDIEPLIYGTQESGMRGGTESTFGIIGLSKAVDCCDISLEHIEDMTNKRYYFINLLESKFGCKLNGHYEYRLPNNINVTFPNVTGESLLYMLEMSDILVSSGSACNSHTNVPSHVLKAIYLTNEEALKTVRFTLPDNITYQDIDKVINEIDKSLKLTNLYI